MAVAFTDKTWNFAFLGLGESWKAVLANLHECRFINMLINEIMN